MKILQIISADGWHAVHADTKTAGDFSYEPLVCWALVDGYDGVEGQEVVGMCSGELSIVTIPDTDLNFLGYSRDLKDDEQKLRDEATDWYKRQERFKKSAAASESASTPSASQPEGSQ